MLWCLLLFGIAVFLIFMWIWSRFFICVCALHFFPFDLMKQMSVRIDSLYIENIMNIIWTTYFFPLFFCWFSYISFWICDRLPALFALRAESLLIRWQCFWWWKCRCLSDMCMHISLYICMCAFTNDYDITEWTIAINKRYGKVMIRRPQINSYDTRSCTYSICLKLILSSANRMKKKKTISTRNVLRNELT